ncbi:MBL fold metallo-hydrolase, partial [Micrococcus endophyticus]
AVLTRDERIDVAGTLVLAWHTPGHTSDSYSFAVPDAGAHGAVITGDTILGSGTTMLDHPDGTLTDYLASLRRLEAAGRSRCCPRT